MEGEEGEEITLTTRCSCKVLTSFRMGVFPQSGRCCVVVQFVIGSKIQLNVDGLHIRPNSHWMKRISKGVDKEGVDRKEGVRY